MVVSFPSSLLIALKKSSRAILDSISNKIDDLTRFRLVAEKKKKI